MNAADHPLKGTSICQPNRVWFVGIVVLASTILIAGLTGCSRFGKKPGPRSIVQDRLPYNNALAHTWKSQTLLNLVKIRYGEPPFFVDVPQIVNGYGLIQRSNGSLGLQSAPSPSIPAEERILGLFSSTTVWSDRPTITYSPQTDAEFIRNLTVPVSPKSVLLLLESGYAVDAVFRLSLQSINGLRNRAAFNGVVQPADPEFIQVVDIFRRAQLSGDFGVRTEMVDSKEGPKEELILRFSENSSSPEIGEQLKRAKSLLGLKPEIKRFSVVFGDAATNENEIAFKPRPIYLMLRDLAPYVNVPAEHLAQGIAFPYDTSSIDSRPLEIHSGCDEPEDAFASVFYRDCWYWIDQNQLESKRTFNYLLLLLALADNSSKQPSPTVTIQAN